MIGLIGLLRFIGFAGLIGLIGFTGARRLGTGFWGLMDLGYLGFCIIGNYYDASWSGLTGSFWGFG